MRAINIGVVALAVFAGNAEAACPNKGLRQTDVVLVTATGRARYTLDVAASEAEQACGLMFRKSMPRSVGMIFPFAPPRPLTFWMENTVLSLDLVFVGPDDRVVSITRRAKPFSRDLIESGGIAASVIELNAGEAKRIGLQPGDQIEQ